MSEEYQRDPFDEEFDAAVQLATELVVHAKRIGLPEIEFPVPDDGHVWVVIARRLRIKDDDPPEPPHAP